ncbi:hypothetical protein T11_10638 [Trichinella zimbabwensis]|uniref:Uncharacterized protein n=1 Tax=Trichinella zimbabwensis TaxID=268475 RepID=A0A0V1HJD0_9BILA|nr:hypothetical protein T11_10638 [Trichinella zimbabwensis]
MLTLTGFRADRGMSWRVFNGLILAKSCSFDCQTGTMCDHPIYINASFTFAGAKTFREKCLYPFVLICSRCLAKEFSDSARSVLIQCAGDVVIHGRVGKNFADVELRINLLETHLRFKLPIEANDKINKQDL